MKFPFDIFPIEVGRSTLGEDDEGNKEKKKEKSHDLFFELSQMTAITGRKKPKNRKPTQAPSPLIPFSDPLKIT